MRTSPSNGIIPAVAASSGQQPIGALAVSPSDPNLIWAGTGEGRIRSHISVGQGVSAPARLSSRAGA